MRRAINFSTSGKAAEGSRTPRPCEINAAKDCAPASWSAAALCRFALLAIFTLQSTSLWACAACYGQSDSPLAHGFNWAILSLLGVVSVVLAGIASFFVYLGKRSADIAGSTGTPDALHTQTPGTPPPTLDPHH